MRTIDADELRDEVLNDNTYDNDTVNYYLGLIDSAPTIDPVKHGHWLYDGRGEYCSECGIYLTVAQSSVRVNRFCPDCGAKMDGEG